MRVRTSLSALTFQAMATMPAMRAPATMVLAFQFAGWLYQPPAGDQTSPRSNEQITRPLEELPSPPVSSSLSAPRLAALHARLTLSPRLPLQTLHRTLIHPTADPDPRFNNASLALLGGELLGYHTAEHLICHYPRLPMSVFFAAQDAYIGPRALSVITREWGVDKAAEPGGEVAPGLLQFRAIPAGAPLTDPDAPKEKIWNRGVSSRIASDDSNPRRSIRTEDPSENKDEVSYEQACTSFVRALVGAVHLHCGRNASLAFHRDHFLSRHLDFAKLFDFDDPARDLSRLCAREGFEPPIARLISETGRLSRHPVFVVGVYSGRDKLGEAAGASLNEGRVRAAAQALKAWYLYSPPEVTKPSSVEGGETGKKWIPNYVDCGEVVA
ncbi:ribonuclease III [Aulographum hederae CBS 113979]|uniref:Large ribosomal subunit protein mL44 n=1 Tax=Aulographum hederae CBS 113979 TaxID=1176131 RepID=A0A6G1HHE9_9PEZI|nr:ribonuclease III [Aulographum hederae CBS 113979]